MKPFVKLATDIMGTKVKTPQGEEIGVVQNLMVDPQQGSIIFIILCYANFVGKVHRLFAIPHHQLTVKYGDNASLFLEIDKHKLMNVHAQTPEPGDNKDIYEILPDESDFEEGEQILHAVQ